MAYRDFKDLNRRTAVDKVLLDKAFNIAKNSKYDGYQRGLASVPIHILEKRTSGGDGTLAQLETLATRNKSGINPNLAGLFRSLFWDGGRGVDKITPPPCRLKVVRIMLETWKLAHKYTLIRSFRKYNFQYQGPFNLADVSIFCKKSVFFV